MEVMGGMYGLGSYETEKLPEKKDKHCCTHNDDDLATYPENVVG